MLLGEIHGNLTYLYDFAFAALGVEYRFVEMVMFAYLADDSIYRYRLVLDDAYCFFDDAFCWINGRTYF